MICFPFHGDDGEDDNSDEADDDNNGDDDNDYNDNHDEDDDEDEMRGMKCAWEGVAAADSCQSVPPNPLGCLLSWKNMWKRNMCVK